MANGTFDLTAASDMCKELYHGQDLTDLVGHENPFMTLVMKKNALFNSGGKYEPVPVTFSGQPGTSTDFSTAQALAASPRVKSFHLTQVPDYVVAYLDNQAILSMDNDKKAFMEAVEFNVDKAIKTSADVFSVSLFRSGTGSIGQISGTVTSGVINLVDANDITNFQLDMCLQATTTDGGSYRTGASTVGYVIALDHVNGKVTVSATFQNATGDTPSGWQDGDYLLMKGTLNARVKGVAAWVPDSAPSSASYFGVDRSVDTRLGGCRISAGTGQSISETLIDGSQLISRLGGRPDFCFTNFTSFGGLIKELGAKVQYTTITHEMTGLSFKGVVIYGHNSDITVIADRNCQGKKAWLLQMDTWGVRAVGGKIPMVLPYPDGLFMVRSASADASELRVGYYGQLGCNFPGANCNCTLNA